MTDPHDPVPTGPIRRFGESFDPESQEAFRLLHSPPDPAHLGRRRFLQGMLAAGGLAAVGLPGLTDRAAAGPPLGPNDKILVTILLSGGNDGLSTVVPADDGVYRSARGTLAVRAGDAQAIGEGLYLHPNLRRLKRRFDDGDVAVVRGVGEASDDHSHFVNLARWMAGTSQREPWYTGWLGRYLDGSGADDLAGVHIGYSGSPLLLARRNGGTTSIPPYGGLFGIDYRQNTYTRPVYDSLLGLNSRAVGAASGEWARRITDTTKGAVRTAARIGPMFPDDDPLADSEDRLLVDATLAARLINLDVGARVIHLTLDGFDMHEGQRPLHDDYMASLDRAIDTIFRKTSPKFRNRVLVMTYSEFGRRVEPTSTGTDHGTAAPLFVVGNAVTGGLYGEEPSLRRLDDRGDLRHSVDFRSVYATVLEGWLGADATEVLGSRFDQLGFLAPTCQGKTATIVGTNGHDVINGTAGADVIVAKGGDDVIRGRGGNDTICGGGGDDVIRGGAGSDRLDGGPGNDRIDGGKGRDGLFGRAGRDRLAGRAGADRLVGGGGRDVLTGGAGRDRIVGTRAVDRIIDAVRDVITAR